MKITDQLCDAQIWRKFWEYRLEMGHTSQKEIEDFYKFYKNKEYEDAVEKVKTGIAFNPPKKKLVSKIESNKKRIVYIFARDENYVLKLITYLLIRKYDFAFAPNLYSFRINNGVHKALHYLTSKGRTDNKFVYKTDVSDYFNSVNVNLLLPKLSSILSDEDVDLFFFIKALLKNPYIYDNGKLVKKEKGIMAGSPLAAFLANVYLNDLDWQFYKTKNIYARYSDDIIVFSPNADERVKSVQEIKTYIALNGLRINENKELYFYPHERWEFLGISYENGKIDVSYISSEKLKKKMRRKARALVRWKNKKGASGSRAARAFIKKFNKKLFENPLEDELTWTRWYFPIINTTDTMKKIDLYQQDCIRYVATGKRTKARYNFTYDDMKKLGYRSLVHEYYKICEETATAKAEG